MESMPIVVLGFMLGMLHAADADHVVAVATIVGRERSLGGAARVGVLWGAGHTATLFVVGSAVIVLGLVIPPRLEQAMEFCVALMLMLLGVMTLSRRTLTTGHALRPVAIGVVHGLAGSAAVALLVLTQIREPAWAAACLLLFGVGTTAGMMLITLVIAFTCLRAHRLPRLGHGVQVIAGALSLALGGWMAWQLGVSDGLLIG